MSESLRMQRLSGSRINAYLPELARLRITVFREFPYLYEGSAAYEENYLKTYVDAAASVMLIVWDGNTVVGASSGLPLLAETENVMRPFREQGYDLERIFYFGESVLLSAYRGQGLGVRFFEEREAHVRALGRFNRLCFCAVERPTDHPRRPADYVPLDRFWQKRGFVKHPELQTTFSWQDLDETSESPKPMTFWLKSLAAQ
jgi:GNAT superfamily N-acetyltransferase